MYYYDEMRKVSSRAHPLAPLYRKIFAGVLRSYSKSAEHNAESSHHSPDITGHDLDASALAFYEGLVGLCITQPPPKILVSLRYLTVLLSFLAPRDRRRQMRSSHWPSTTA